LVSVNGGTSRTSDEVLFDLNFPGGTAKDLVEAINKVLPQDEQVNVVVPPQDINVQLPSLRMKGVTIPALFESLSTERHEKDYRIMYGFRRTSATPPVWTFYVLEDRQGPSAGPSPNTAVCRFFALNSYLQSHTIEDITTAIRTGYEMLGGEVPAMKFHPETSLLIAVGPPAQLQLIDQALKALSENPAPVDPTTGRPIRTLPATPRIIAPKNP
jgi:hypothetical protein